MRFVLFLLQLFIFCPSNFIERVKYVELLPKHSNELLCIVCIIVGLVLAQRCGNVAVVVKSIQGVCARGSSVRGKVSGSEGVVNPPCYPLLLYYTHLQTLNIYII